MIIAIAFIFVPEIFSPIKNRAIKITNIYVIAVAIYTVLIIQNFNAKKLIKGAKQKRHKVETK